MSSELTVTPASDRATADEPVGRSPWWLLDRLALALSTLSGVVLFLLIGRGGWYIDDFLNLSLAQESRLGRFYLDRPIFGHPQPGTRLANWLLYRIAPMNYAVAAALVCAAVAFSAWMVYRILRLTFRPSPWLLVPTSMACTTGLWVPVAAWWAGGSEISGCILANTLTVHAVLRCYFGRRKLLWGVLAGLWMIGGLAFYERALLGGLFAVCFLLTFACLRLSPREIFRVTRQAWAAFVVLPVVAVAYLGYYLTHNFVRAQPGYTRLDVLHFFWVAWSQSLIPGLFGGTLRTGKLLALSYATPPIWWQAACELLLVALVVLGFRRNGVRALVAWCYFLPLFAGASYAIATARLHVHGPGVGREFRYLADLLPLAVLTLAASLFRPSRNWLAAAGQEVDPEDARVQPSRLTGRRVDRWLARPGAGTARRLLPVVAGLCALWLVYAITAGPVSSRWRHARSVNYVANMQTTIRQQDRLGPWSAYTQYVPGDVSISSYGRYSFTTRIAQLAMGRPISADDLSKPMFVFAPNGRLRPARFQVLATTPDACSTTDGLRVMQPLSKPLGPGFWTVQLNYSTPTPTTLRFALNTAKTGIIEATGSYLGFPVHGSGRLTFLLRSSSPTGFRLDASRPGVCVSAVQFGRPLTAG